MFSEILADQEMYYESINACRAGNDIVAYIGFQEICFSMKSGYHGFISISSVIINEI